MVKIWLVMPALAANRHLKGLGVFVTSLTLFLGTLVGVPVSRAQGPSEDETIKFIEQISHEAAKDRGTRPSGVEDHAAVFIQIQGQTIRSNYIRTWYNPESRGLGGYIYRHQAHLADLAEVRLEENAIVFKCRDAKGCIEERREDTHRKVTSINTTSSFSVRFRQDTGDEQRRIVKALLHLYKLRGLELEDGTLNKDLFK